MTAPGETVICMDIHSSLQGSSPSATSGFGVTAPGQAGKVHGKEEPVALADRREARKCEKPLDVVHWQPVLDVLRRFEPQPLRELEHGFPQVVVVRDDQTGSGTRQVFQAGKGLLHIFQIPDKVREDDVVEATGQSRTMGIALDNM